MESQNLALDGGGMEPLYAWAISTKRYALFNLGPNGEIILRKASAHGLGHLRPPYGDDALINVPAPQAPLAEIGVNKWQHDFWYQIVKAALEGAPN